LKTLLVISLITVLAFTGFAQERTVKIIGEIKASDSNKPVPYVHIVNKNTNEGTVSNQSGRFWINMSSTDTLLLSSVGYEKNIFTLKDSIAVNQLVINIEMNTSTLQLAPVSVYAFRDEEALKRALLNIKPAPPKPQEVKEIHLPGFYYGPRKEPKEVRFGTTSDGSFGVGVAGALTKFANVFSKEKKEKRKLASYQEQADYRNLIKAKYNQAVIIELTGLPEDRVEDFIAFCDLDESFIEKASEYEMAVAITQCHTLFIFRDEE